MMEGTGNGVQQKREEIFSKVVRAGKRTYFFDVKATRSNDFYLTITESKRRFSNEENKFFYEKHKLFLYKEDFDKFSEGLSETIFKIQELKELHPQTDPVSEQDSNVENNEESTESAPFSDVSFEDLGSDSSDSLGSTEDAGVTEQEETAAQG